jgi:hypothetical protein
MLILATLDKDLKEAMFLPNRDSFKGMWNFLKIGIPSAALLCFDIWCFDIMTLFAAYLTTDETAA